VRFYNAVDWVNPLEKEKQLGQATHPNRLGLGNPCRATVTDAPRVFNDNLYPFYL
jgi:hypothetical protein